MTYADEKYWRLHLVATGVLAYFVLTLPSYVSVAGAVYLIPSSPDFGVWGAAGGILLGCLVLITASSSMDRHRPNALFQVLAIEMALGAGFMWVRDMPSVPEKVWYTASVYILVLVAVAAYAGTMSRLLRELAPNQVMLFFGVWGRFAWEMLLPMAAFCGTYLVLQGEPFLAAMIVVGSSAALWLWTPRWEARDVASP